MAEIKSSGFVAGGPMSTGKLMVAEGPNAVGELMEEADAPKADTRLVVEDCETPAPAF